MKNLKRILLVLLLLVMVVPFNTISAKEKVKVYIFRGEGCPHCQDAEDFFDSIKGDYGKYYRLISYEVWNNEENSALMEATAKALNTEASGVPFIVIGDKYYSGFTDNMGDEIKTKIKDLYKNGSKDVMKYVSEDVKANAVSDQETSADSSESNSKDAVALIIILVVLCLIVLLIIYARNKTNEKDKKEKAPVKEEQKTTTTKKETTPKKKTTKKTNTKK